MAGGPQMRLPTIASALLAFFCLVAVAQAAVIHDFRVDLRDEKPYGAATVHLTEKTFDTTGAVPPATLSGTAWLPKGISIRAQFLKKPYVCNLRKLNETKNPSVCRRARIGTGKALIDIRPLVAEPFPVNLQIFLAKATATRAVASYAVFGVPDERAPLVRNSPGIRDARALVIGTIFDDPTPDGLYGYRIEVPQDEGKGEEDLLGHGPGLPGVAQAQLEGGPEDGRRDLTLDRPGNSL